MFFINIAVLIAPSLEEVVFAVSGFYAGFRLLAVDIFLD
jgi:hypothetical protein